MTILNNVLQNYLLTRDNSEADQFIQTHRQTAEYELERLVEYCKEKGLTLSIHNNSSVLYEFFPASTPPTENRELLIQCHNEQFYVGKHVGHKIYEPVVNNSGTRIVLACKRWAYLRSSE